MTTPEERLLKAIFDTEDADMEPMPENYPGTTADKVDYAGYALTADLSDIGKAIIRLNHLNRLLIVADKDEGKLPDIILGNELHMALEPLMRVREDIDEVTDWLLELYKHVAQKTQAAQKAKHSTEDE